MSNTRISVPFIKNKTIAVSKLYHVSLQLVGFSVLRSKIGWGTGGGVKMKGKKQDSKNVKGDLLANGWGTLQSGVALHLNRGSFLTVGKMGSLRNGKQFSTVYNLVNQRNVNKMFTTKEEL